ncbi:DUF4872 domain-containing protein [Muricauda sp. MAR_2010_75]|uniref:DUF4872 domain-containing protein n=1 Tax=Allomuricauda sp. MAR_2010_75 TaxID=1250232 RepID=UPI00056A92A0|nr:DUF4872 domain-containing protein [Muricauda sp. MAR_2010_75]
MDLTEKYRLKYISGFDCRMTTFRNTLATCFEYNVSNGMMVGLSGCLTMVYGDPIQSRIPFYTLAGLTDQSLEGLSTVFGVYLTRGKFQRDDIGILDSIKGYLSQGIVVNVALNRPLLVHVLSGKSINEFKWWPSNVGFHYVSITSIEDGSVVFFETDCPKPISLDFKIFKLIWFCDEIFTRSSKDPMQLCNGTFYTIQNPSMEAHKNELTIRFAIEKVTNGFLNKRGNHTHGIVAIRKFHEGLSNWNPNMDKEQLLNSLELIYVLERFLSGGGFGRRLYSSFLSEAASIIEDQDLKSIASDFRETSDLWSTFVRKLCNVEVKKSILIGDFEKLRSILNQNVDLILHAEESQFISLATWSDKTKTLCQKI